MASTHELQSTLQALGYFEDGKYYKTKDCLNATKDLLRYLRRDDEHQRTIRIELLKSDTISNDLIPIMKTLEYDKNEQLFDVCLRLLVNLTQSSLICYNFKIPNDKLENEIFLKIDNYLQNHKESFADVNFLKFISIKLKEILNKNWQSRLEEEEHIIERILLLIRNVLFIKCDSEQDTVNVKNLSSHDKLILALEKSGFLEILIKFCNSKNELKYSNYLLEILKRLLRDQTAADLAIADADLFNNVQKEKDTNELNALKTREDYIRRLNRKKLNPRHSRFAGTYTAMNMKAINDNNYQICHNPINDFDDLLDDTSKKSTKQSKIYLLDLKDKNKRTDANVRNILHHFCVDFLKRSYNIFMSYLFDSMRRNKLVDNEICWFYGLIQFFTEFTRNLKENNEMVKYERIKITFTVEIFHSLESFISKCIEMFRLEKREIPLWIKRMHKAINCFKELLIMIKSIDDKTNATDGLDEQLVESCKEVNKIIQNLKNQIFSIPEFREFFTRIFKEFNKSSLNINMLRTLIETNQVFFDIFEKQTPEKQQELISEKPKSKEKPSAKFTIFDTYANEIFDALRVEFDENLEKHEIFNNDCNDDEKKDLIYETIYNLLNDKDFKQAVNLLRQAKQQWPLDKDKFGSSNGMVDEFDKLKEIYLSIDDENTKANSFVDNPNDDEEEDDDDNLFDFKLYLHRYAHPQILKFYINIFGEYSTNTDYQNKCCLKMFKYISEIIELPQCFYQLSLFNIINKFYKDPLRKLETSSNYQEFNDFFRQILRKFFDRLKINNDLFLTILFLKDREYLDVDDSVLPKKSKKKSVIRSNTKYDEHLTELFYKFSVDTSEENEILDKIINELKVGEEQKKRICKRLIDMNLIKSNDLIKNTENTKRRKISVEWNEEDHEELKVCYQKLKEENTEKIVDVLKKSLKKNRKKNDIILKLLELNIISRKSELYSKRKSKKTNENKKNEFSSDSEVIETPNTTDAEDDEGNDKENENDEIQLNNEDSNTIQSRKRSLPSDKSDLESITNNEQNIIFNENDDDDDTSLTTKNKPKRQRVLSVSDEEIEKENIPDKM